jgi:L-lactate dehydrogenase complex protein LldG
MVYLMSSLAEQEQNTTVRRDMLAAIRRQLAASAPFEAVQAEHHQAPAIVARSSAAVPTVAPVDSPVERFRKALEAVSGECIVVNSEIAAAVALQQIIEQKLARRIAVSDASLVQRVMQHTKHDAELVENAAPLDLFACDAGITSAQWAIAETGTLVLESEAERHRLSSLVPPVHIAIIEAACIRETLSEVLQTISQNGQDRLSPTVTLITGPSRTSDIELTLAIGVHGPGELYVVIIDEGSVVAGIVKQTVSLRCMRARQRATQTNSLRYKSQP